MRTSLRRLIIALEFFVAVSAFAGALALFVWRHGGGIFPLSMLQWSPFETFTAPAALLGAVGAVSLVCGVLVWRRSSFAIDVTLLAGGSLSVWIVAETAVLREFSWLQVLYGAIGLLVLAVGVGAAWRSGVQRHRWLVVVTACEAAGFLAPSVVGTLSANAGFGAWPRLWLLTAAGAFEGLLLGAGQAFALPFVVRRARYAVATSLAAAFVWAFVMSMMLLGESGVPAAWVITVAVIGGPLALIAIGFAQWLVMREQHRPSASWVGWTALAWAVALPLSFAPGPFVDEATPIVVHLLLWSSAGLLMAWVMALITWRGVVAVSGSKLVRTRFRGSEAGDEASTYRRSVSRWAR